MLIDLHCHSMYSYDNHLEPWALMERACELGLDGVCFTEHNSLEASRSLEEMEIPDGLLVLRAVEISTDLGHLLAYGLTDDSWNRWGRNYFLKLSSVMAAVHELGGICVPAHPFRGWESLGDRIYHLPGLDAIETHNGANTLEMNRLALHAAETMDLPSVGGSDCHRIDQVGRAVTEFRNRITCMEDVVREIKARNCRGIYLVP